MLSIDTCQNKLFTDQCHVTILRAQVQCSSSSHVFLKLSAGLMLWFWIGSQAQARLTNIVIRAR